MFLAETGLPERLWGELASTAPFLKNRMPHTIILGNDTPYYRMFGNNYIILFLRDIGLRAFVHEKAYYERLYQRAWEDALVGYNNDSLKAARRPSGLVGKLQIC